MSTVSIIFPHAPMIDGIANVAKAMVIVDEWCGVSMATCTEVAHKFETETCVDFECMDGRTVIIVED